MTENLLYGLSVMVLGMGIVFIALTLLILVIELIARFFAPKAAVAGEAPTNSVPQDVNGRLVAAIAAALACAMEDGDRRYVITGIRRIEGENWKTAGRNRVIASHGLVRPR